MLLLIIFSMIFIILFIFLGIDVDSKTYKSRFILQPRQLLALLVVLVYIPFATIQFIPANSVGIKFNQFSGVSEDVLTEGMKFKSPFDQIHIISTEVRTKAVENISGQTKDAQWIKITMDIKYQVSSADAFKIFRQFRTLDNVDDVLLSPLVQRAIESVTTKFNVIDILGEKRNEVYTLIELEVKNKLAESGIKFFSLVLTDTDAGAAIEQAIEQEAVAKKAVETALQAQARAEIEAQTKVLQAEAASKVVLIEAQASSDANKLLTESITPEILKRMEMEARIKWGWITVQTGTAIVDVTP